MPDVAVVVLTYNEERHIARALASVRGFASELYVVDSLSSDRTVEIAEAAGARVLINRFVSQAQQFDWALRTAPIAAGWVLRLDADEIISPELSAEIQRRLPTLPRDVTGVSFNRRHVFLGRWIKHGGRYPLTLLRLWRRGAVRVEQRWMDEHMALLHGRAVTFEHDFIDHNLSDLTSFVAKHNQYATREAIEMLLDRYGLRPSGGPLLQGETSAQATRKRWIKQRLYNRLPLWLGPLSYFLYRYVVRFGWRDGPEGLIYHGLQGFWYRFLVGAKLFAFDRELRALDGAQARLAKLSGLTGYDISTLKGDD